MTQITQKKGWIMHSHNHFTRQEGGYVADLKLGGFYPMWFIFKDGVQVTAAPYHRPVTSNYNKELAAKAQIEKILNELP